jgi:nitrogen regulatory protein PII
MISLIVAVIKPHKLDDVREALTTGGVTGITVTEVTGFGRQRGKTENFRGSEYHIDFLPKVKVEVIVATEDVERVSMMIADAARTGKIGDGKIWTFDLQSLTRIRTGETGGAAI